MIKKSHPFSITNSFNYLLSFFHFTLPFPLPLSPKHTRCSSTLLRLRPQSEDALSPAIVRLLAFNGPTNSPPLGRHLAARTAAADVRPIASGRPSSGRRSSQTMRSADGRRGLRLECQRIFVCRRPVCGGQTGCHHVPVECILQSWRIGLCCEQSAPENHFNAG